MHKDGKWAKQIIALQENDGKWGCFHTLQTSYGASLTTEQALRRLEHLGYTIKDECIYRAVYYMSDCLTGEASIPDRMEKSSDWDIFTALMLAAWIRRFTLDNPSANEIALQWAAVLSAACRSGAYRQKDYELAYYDIFKRKPRGDRLIDCAQFYTVSLLSSSLDSQCEYAFLNYVLCHDAGIYYIYNSKLTALPSDFESRQASRFLAAIELLAKYPHAKGMLQFVLEWLDKNRNNKGCWDMGRSVYDKVYFPLSDDWKKQEVREADCTERISKLILELT